MRKETNLDMSSKKSLVAFVQEASKSLPNFDPKNDNIIKELIVKAIEYYQLQTVVGEEMKVIYINSMAEENILSRLVELTRGEGSEMSIESLYEGCIVRNY